MAVRPRPIVVNDETDLLRLLNQASLGPVLLTHGGLLYRLSLTDASDADDTEPNPEEVMRVLDQVAGSWGDLDVDQLIEDLYEARRQGSRPYDRP